MADETARIQQLEATLWQLREQRAADRAEIAALRAEVAAGGARESALASVLRVIASSPADLQAVLQAIVEAACRLCDAPGGMVLQLREPDGRLAPRAAHGAMRDEYARLFRNPFTDSPGMPPTRESVSPGMPPTRESVAGRAFKDDASPATPSSPLATRPSPLVLVIDDDVAARELLRRHLEGEGLRVITAASGEDGLRLARELRPALITLDVLMPGLDGWAVLGTLKADPATAQIPVIVVTIVGDRDLGYAIGAADYLTKPIDRDRLAAAVRRLVPAASARQALIVEDDPATREMLRRSLQHDGWAVTEAANGRVGLERVAAEAPDLILLDLMMPELDGFEFVERLRAKPAWRTIPVLVITAKDLMPEERLRLTGSVERILQKGAYSREQLLGEVRTMVRATLNQAERPTPAD